MARKKSSWHLEEKRRKAQNNSIARRARTLIDALRGFADDLRIGSPRYNLVRYTEGQRALVEIAHFHMRRFAAGERSRS